MNDLRTEARREFVADVADIKRRLTLAELNEAERAVRTALQICERHQERAYRGDVIAALTPLNFCLGTHSSGNPAIYWNPCAESELAEMLMSLGADLQARLPRKCSAIWASVRLDVRRCVLWFELPNEPEDIPYGAAA